MEENFNNGFCEHNHYELVKVEENKVTVKAALTEEANNLYGIAHGGFIFGLGDTAMGMAVRTTGKNPVTLNANISYLRPGKGKELFACGELTKIGNKICFAEAKIMDENNQLVATMTGSYYFKN